MKVDNILSHSQLEKDIGATKEDTKKVKKNLLMNKKTNKQESKTYEKISVIKIDSKSCMI